jgi:hypothetical protein
MSCVIPCRPKKMTNFIESTFFLWKLRHTIWRIYIDVSEEPVPESAGSTEMTVHIH